MKINDILSDYVNLKETTKHMLATAVSSGYLSDAWETLVELEELLPKLDWVPSKIQYPQVRKYIDMKARDYGWERNSYHSFYELLEEESNLLLEGGTDQDFIDLEYSKELITAMMWEVVRGGCSGFTYDW